LIAAAVLAAPVVAAPIKFSTLLNGELAYGTNPFLRPGVSMGSAFFRGSVAPKLSYDTGLTQTELDASYQREQYFRAFGHTETVRTNLTRSDQWSSRLRTNLTASYLNTNNASISDPTAPVINLIDLGRRTKMVSGNASLQWTAGAKDAVTYSVGIQHQTYSRAAATIPQTLASSYTLYDMSTDYTHTLDSRTTIGVQASAYFVRSQRYPDTRSLQPALTLRRQLTAAWTLEGQLGVIFQHVAAPISRSNTSLSFGAKLCGVYTRTNICLEGHRAESPSGYGSLRKTTSFLASVDRAVSEHSHLRLNASYLKSDSSTPPAGALVTLRQYSSLQAGAGYDRELSTRWSAGVDGLYRWRKTGQVGTAHGVTGSVHVTAKLGRM